MADFEESRSFISFKDLCGVSVGLNDIITEIAKLPLDGILGFLAGVSLEMIQEEDAIFNPGFQGKYLQLAIVDDFPQKIPGAYKMFCPGRVPFTGRRHVFLHEQNLAWLCHAALLYSNENHSTLEISYDLQCRLFRLLLIINDLLSVAHIEKPYDLNKRRNFSLHWLRHGQFNRHFGHQIKILVKLARQKVLLLDILPKHYKGVQDAFSKAMGLSIEKYFYVLCLFVNHLYKGMAIGNHWLSARTFTSKIKKNKMAIEIVLSSWARTPSQYRDACNVWRRERKDFGELPNYDFVPLRETPVIEGRPGQLICPIPSFLFSKIDDGPFFILSDFLRGAELTRFHVALGEAYEEYAHKLVERIAAADIGGPWVVSRSPRTQRGCELADSYLQRNKTAIVFEHKGQRPGTEFLRGEQDNRVLGPSRKRAYTIRK